MLYLQENKAFFIHKEAYQRDTTETKHDKSRSMYEMKSGGKNNPG